MLFYWLLLWMDWWEVCNDFTLCSPIHVLFHLAGFFKIFTLLLFFLINIIIMCFGVILCLFYLEFFEFLGSANLEFSSNSENLAIMSSNHFLVISFYFPSSGTLVTEMLDCFLLPHSSPNPVPLFSVFFPLCCYIWHSFYCYDFNFTNIYFVQCVSCC